MKKLGKLSLKKEKILSHEELVSFRGGSGDTCPSGEFSCTCNNISYGCVSTTQECWDKC